MEPYVGRWLEEGHQFVLEEDNDSGHGPKQMWNPVRLWKEAHGLRHFFSCCKSPDLSPIENCRSVPEEHTKRFGLWDEEGLRTIVQEGLDQLSQETINRWVESMPRRL